MNFLLLSLSPFIVVIIIIVALSRTGVTLRVTRLTSVITRKLYFPFLVLGRSIDIVMLMFKPGKIPIIRSIKPMATVPFEAKQPQ